MIIYTDGACKNNKRSDNMARGIGGWAFIILEENPGYDMVVRLKGSGRKIGTTNQEMEIAAVAEALEQIGLMNYKGKITVYSDSAYVINCLNDRWYDKWISNGWMTSKKRPVENRAMWHRLVGLVEELSSTNEIEFYHVYRNSTKYIKEVDSMAKRAAKTKTSQE